MRASLGDLLSSLRCGDRVQYAIRFCDEIRVMTREGTGDVSTRRLMIPLSLEKNTQSKINFQPCWHQAFTETINRKIKLLVNTNSPFVHRTIPTPGHRNENRQ